MGADQADDDETRYHHDFTEDELEMMLYQWDAEAMPVKEYHYMKPEWQTADAVISGKAPTETVPPRPVVDIEEDAEDNGHKTIVDLDKNAPPDEKLVYFDLDTQESVILMEFYAPQCPHCRHFKPHYIEVAAEVTRRSIGIDVKFMAISCQLYREICRAYKIKGFPSVYAWHKGMNIQEAGIEMNRDGVTMTADLVGQVLEIPLATEQVEIMAQNFTTPEEERKFKARMLDKAKEAAEKKRTWHEHPSTLNDRYHNAAVSLGFALTTSVFEKFDELDDMQALALKEFLELIDWATPQWWHVRTGMIEELLRRYVEIVYDGEADLRDIVERHQSVSIEGGMWGDIDIKRNIGKMDGLGVDAPRRTAVPLSADSLYWKNIKWTEACTHNERGMGYTCGLWDLFHILTIGASMPKHRMHAFHSGYPVAPKDVAEVIKRFIRLFFNCDVCRFHFVAMYDRCAHNHCERLIDMMPELSDTKDPEEEEQQGRELAIWLWEVHNSINVRLMGEAAAREQRNVTAEEEISSIFPTKEICPTCWVDDEMKQYDRDELYNFLKNRYW